MAHGQFMYIELWRERCMRCGKFVLGTNSNAFFFFFFFSSQNLTIISFSLFYSCSQREETIISDEIMVVNAGNSLKNLFQTPERAVSVKRVVVLVAGIVIVLISMLLFTFYLVFWKNVNINYTY